MVDCIVLSHDARIDGVARETGDVVDVELAHEMLPVVVHRTILRLRTNHPTRISDDCFKLSMGEVPDPRDSLVSNMRESGRCILEFPYGTMRLDRERRPVDAALLVADLPACFQPSQVRRWAWQILAQV